MHLHACAFLCAHMPIHTAPREASLKVGHFSSCTPRSLLQGWDPPCLQHPLALSSLAAPFPFPLTSGYNMRQTPSMAHMLVGKRCHWINKGLLAFEPQCCRLAGGPVSVTHGAPFHPGSPTGAVLLVRRPAVIAFRGLSWMSHSSPYRSAAFPPPAHQGRPRASPSPGEKCTPLNRLSFL